MNVVLDATHITDQPSGARSRILELYTRVASLKDVKLKVIIQIHSGLDKPFEEAGAKTVKVFRPVPAWRRGIRALNPLARNVDHDPSSELLAAEALPLPPMLKKPLVATIHDLRFLKKEWVSRARYYFAKRWMEKNLLQARKVVTVSQAMKAEMSRAFPLINKDKIHVVLNAAPSLAPITKSEAEDVLKRLKVQSPYLLYLGHLEPRKNIVNLINSYALLKKSIHNVALVLSGKLHNSYGNRALRSCQKQFGLNGDSGLHLTGPVSEKEKAVLLSKALLVVQPSRYEGFGMGVLEALSLGIPVACSNIDAHKEVGGEALLYFNPNDPQEMARAMAKGIQDKDLRSTIAKTGPKQAESFSWERSAESLVKVWKEALTTPH